MVSIISVSITAIYQGGEIIGVRVLCAGSIASMEFIAQNDVYEKSNKNFVNLNVKFMLSFVILMMI